MKTGKMLGYSFQGVVKSGAYRVLFLGVILSVALSVLFLTMTDSLLYTTSEKRKNLYGEFTDTYYGMTEVSNFSLEENFNGMIGNRNLKQLLGENESRKITDTGNIYAADVLLWRNKNIKEGGEGFSLETVLEKRIEESVGFLGEARTDGLLSAGYADGKARELGRLELKMGDWPEKGQAVITDSLNQELASLSGDKGAEVGDFVSLGGKSYEISGIINDYGMLWVSNINQTDFDRMIPEILLSGEDFKELMDTLKERGGGSDNLAHRTLMKVDGVFSKEIYEEDFRLVQNSIINNERFSVPLFLLILVYICSALLLMQILVLGGPRLNKRMQMYRLLGVEAGKIPLLFYLDIFLVFILSLPAGLLAGIGGGWLICAAGSSVFHLEFLFRIKPGVVAGSVLTTGGILAVSGAFPAIRLACGKILDVRGVTFRRKKHAASGLLLCLLIFSIFCLYGFLKCYLKADERLNLSYPVYGKMATDYDYEFLASVISSDTSYRDENGNHVGLSTMEPDDIFTVYNEPYLGMDEENLQFLKETEGVRKVSAYKECTQLQMPINRNDSYQQFLEEDLIGGAGRNYSDEVTEIFGLEEAYMEAKLQGYPAEELLSLAPYVEEGRINLDKIRSGEEVVLVVPDIQVETSEYNDGNGNTGLMTQIHYLEKGEYSGLEGQHSDRYYRVGDTVTLTRLYSENQGLRGFVKENTVKNEVKRQDITVKIGAIIRCRVGWFENVISPEPYFSFLCLNETFDAVGISSTYTRVRIYGEGGQEKNALEQIIYRLSENLPEMRLDDRCRFMEEYRQYHMLLSVLGILLTGLSAVMGAGMFLGQMLMRIREDRKRTGLYQIAGCTRKELFLCMLKPFMIGLPAIWAAAMAAVYAVSERYYRLEGYWGIGSSGECLAAAVFLAAAVILFCRKVFFKESISSLIREED